KGIKGLKSHVRALPGVPDIVYAKEKVAIFVNGCFWHRCPKCGLKLPKSHKPFWRLKFSKNEARDKKNIKLLRKKGWAAITVWECEIKKDNPKVVKRIERALEKKRLKK
ncbi:MAG: very short patch repair endonuclease, partial [Candidatus Margulisiibacteriota bacterium]